jgi:nitric oxide dioxygenase
MNQNAVKLVQESWYRVEAAGPVAAEYFCNTLLGSRPWLTVDYIGHVDERDAMLMQTFGQLIRGMHRLDSHASFLLQVGRINACCGIQAHHYPYFAVALLQTLSHVLGDAFTEPVRNAWTKVIGAMTRLMLAGASGASGVSIAIRQSATDRRHQRRRAARDLDGIRGYHRRATPESNRRNPGARVPSGVARPAI